MRYVQNTMAARRPVQLDPMQSIPVVLTSRTTQRRRVRPRREEQVPLACQWMRPRSGMQRAVKARSLAHFRGRIPKGPLLRAPVRGVTQRDGGCDSVPRSAGAGAAAKAPVQSHISQPLRPFPLHSSRVRVRGALFASGVVAHSLFGPAKRRRSRLAGSENRCHRTRERL